jgi:ABC-2 type transport system permease protein
MKRVLRNAVHIGLVSIRVFARDPVGIAFVFIVPLALIFVIGVTLGGSSLNVAVLDHGSGALGHSLHNSLDAIPDVTLRSYSSLGGLRGAVRRGEVAAGIVIPPGYDRALRTGEHATVRVVSNPKNTAGRAIRTNVDEQVARQASVVRAARVATAQGGGSLDANLVEARRAARDASVETIASPAVGPSGLAGMSGLSYAAPGQLVFFIFMNALAGTYFVEWRHAGLFHRMLAAPLGPGTITAGLGLERLLRISLQVLVIVTVSVSVFNVSWGDPIAAAALLGAFALVAESAALLMGSLARTSEQVTSVGPMLGIAFGMLGGCLWPLAIVPVSMRVIGHFTPHAWVMDGFIEVIGNRGSLGDIVPELAVLLGFAAVMVPLSVATTRRALKTS